jgi:hypothetical protein
VIFEKEIKEELGVTSTSVALAGTNTLISSRSPFRATAARNPAYDLGTKVSDLSSKTKTQLRISDKNYKRLEAKVREFFKKPNVTTGRL